MINVHITAAYLNTWARHFGKTFSGLTAGSVRNNINKNSDRKWGKVVEVTGDCYDYDSSFKTFA